MHPVEQLLRWRVSLVRRLYTRMLAGRFHEFGNGSSITPPFRFANLGQISVGMGVEIQRDCWIHALKGSPNESGLKLIIKAYAGIGMGATISAARRIVIGEHVLLARNVYISDHGHAYEDVEKPVVLQGITNVQPVEIGDGTWLGQNVCVLPGVEIGRNCVVGANAVVNRSIPDFCVAVGAPARVIKRYNEETRVWEKISPVEV